jgi:hypothetical protein
VMWEVKVKEAVSRVARVDEERLTELDSPSVASFYC